MSRKEILYSIAGVLMATIVSAAVFFVVPGGFRIALGKEATTLDKGREGWFGIQLAPGAAQYQVNLVADSLSRLYIPKAEAQFLNESSLDRSQEISVITRDMMLHLSASNILTALSWTEEDIVVPVYEKAMESALKKSEEVMKDSAYFRDQATKSHAILRISIGLLRGSRDYASCGICTSYLASLKVADPAMVQGGPVGRFRYSEKLRRFFSSVSWLQYSTSVERSRDPHLLVMLGFITATDFGSWSALSQFYNGLNNATGIDALRLSTASASCFGGVLDEDNLRDQSKLDLFVKATSGDWHFPFQTQLFSERPSLSNLVPDGKSVSMSEKFAALISEMKQPSLPQADALSLDKRWLQLISTIGPTRIATEGEGELRASSSPALPSYLLLLYSYPRGLILTLPSKGNVFIEADPQTYRSLKAVLDTVTQYLNSTSGSSKRVGDLLTESKHLLSLAGELSGKGFVPIGQELKQSIISLMKQSSIEVPFFSKTQLDASTYEGWSVAWRTVHLDAGIGLEYQIIEARSGD